MIAFYRAYPDPPAFSPPAVAKLPPREQAPQAVAKTYAQDSQEWQAQTLDSHLWTVPWAHHVVLLEKVKDLAVRRWYMEQTLANGWSRNVLALQIGAGAHARHGKAVSIFAALLPEIQNRASRGEGEVESQNGCRANGPTRARRPLLEGIAVRAGNSWQCTTIACVRPLVRRDRFATGAAGVKPDAVKLDIATAASLRELGYGG